MSYLRVLFFLSLTSPTFAGEATWLCTEESSQRQGNTILACGIGMGKDENQARSEAFIASNSEFKRICDASDDCKDHVITVEPKRTSCESINNEKKCYRLLAFNIGEAKAVSTTVNKQAGVASSDLGQATVNETKTGALRRNQKLRYGMSLSDAMSLLGSPESSKTFDDTGETIFQYSGKMCVNQKKCFLSVDKDKVLGFTAFQPRIIEATKLNPKIRIGMALSELVGTFGKPYSTKAYSSSSGTMMLIYVGDICKDRKMCPVILHDGLVVQHEFDPSYTSALPPAYRKIFDFHEGTIGSRGGVAVYYVSGNAPILGSLDPSKVTEAVASGHFSFPKRSPISVVNPEGVRGAISPEEAPAAFQQGYRYDVSGK